MHSLKYFLKTASAGYIAKLGVLILALMFKKKKGALEIIQMAIDRDTFSFGGFVGLVWLISKLSLWSLRRIRGTDDIYNSIIAGALSSFAILFDSGTNGRKTLALYVFARSFDSLIRTLDSNKIISERKHWGLALYIVMTNWISFMMVFNPEVRIVLNMSFLIKQKIKSIRFKF